MRSPFGREAWEESNRKADEKRERKEEQRALEGERIRKYGPGAVVSTMHLRKRMHGTFRHLLTGMSDMAVVDAIALNTEATLLLIDKLDAYMEKNNGQG